MHCIELIVAFIIFGLFYSSAVYWNQWFWILLTRDKLVGLSLYNIQIHFYARCEELNYLETKLWSTTQVWPLYRNLIALQGRPIDCPCNTVFHVQLKLVILKHEWIPKVDSNAHHWIKLYSILTWDIISIVIKNCMQ